MTTSMVRGMSFIWVVDISIDFFMILGCSSVSFLILYLLFSSLAFWNSLLKAFTIFWLSA
ncbi:MAG: hypothetical protein A4E31_00518 [Methanomassiliicoccales archaeon PtaU1.Bin030]|nr:MAG: hypothetical protein A4E31_00518 [Methanomassiliicoccales archaeon PtaU1.Bin030]